MANKKSIIVVLSFLFLLFPRFAFATWAGWEWSWETRTDGDGKPAGHYTGDTPFPVDETMSTYTITNEDGDKTLTLGTVYFVDDDATDCTNGETDYDPTYNGGAGACDQGGSYTIYTSIGSAVNNVSGGNKTILVRDGAYDDWGISLKGGNARSGNTYYQYSIIGYKQERPIVDGSLGSGSDGFNMANYSTLQRITFQNHAGVGVDATSTYPFLIDLNLDAVAMGWGSPATGVYASASSTHYNWAFHITVRHTTGHCYKNGDGATNSTLEFNHIYECGWWPGLTDSYTNQHAAGIDLPESGYDHQIRYNIVHDTLMYGIYIEDEDRQTSTAGTHWVHHNEVYNGTHLDQRSGARSSSHGARMVYIDSSTSDDDIQIYGNIFRDAGGNSGDTDSIALYIGTGTYSPVEIYNNLIYNAAGYPVRIDSSPSNVKFYGNTVYDNDSQALINTASDSSYDFKNNIIYQAGSGACMSVGSATHTYNQYYAPSGSVGVTLGTGELNSNPQWSSAPSGAWSIGEGELTASSPGKDTGTPLGSPYDVDASNLSRPQHSAWDMGAFEGMSLRAPNNLRIVQ